jgi:ABC-type branched-subunit amino acid transport system permease subunit
VLHPFLLVTFRPACSIARPRRVNRRVLGAAQRLTGIGGAIYAQYAGYIDPDSVMAGQFSILIALPAVLGGFGLMLYGATIVLVTVARPQGLVSLLARPAQLSTSRSGSTS